MLRGPPGPLAAVGGLSHGLWRSFENERRAGEWKGFVDGDLVSVRRGARGGWAQCLFI